LLGVVFRHCVLFPLRLTLLVTSHLVFFIIFFSLKAIMANGPAKLRMEQRLIRVLAGMYVASFTGVINFHGPQPTPGVCWCVCGGRLGAGGSGEGRVL
jgi:glycerol-3-phosphate O-acyltransferase 3/4